MWRQVCGVMVRMPASHSAWICVQALAPDSSFLLMLILGGGRMAQAVGFLPPRERPGLSSWLPASASGLGPPQEFGEQTSEWECMNVFSLSPHLSLCLTNK